MYNETIFFLGELIEDDRVWSSYFSGLMADGAAEDTW